MLYVQIFSSKLKTWHEAKMVFEIEIGVSYIVSLKNRFVTVSIYWTLNCMVPVMETTHYRCMWYCFGFLLMNKYILG